MTNEFTDKQKQLIKEGQLYLVEYTYTERSSFC